MVNLSLLLHLFECLHNLFLLFISLSADNESRLQQSLLLPLHLLCPLIVSLYLLEHLLLLVSLSLPYPHNILLFFLPTNHLKLTLN